MGRKYLTVKQIQKLDDVAINVIGIPSVVLMENAGKSVVVEIKKMFAQKRRPSVLVFCGLGNNAGDGFVVARHLHEQGYKVKVFMLGAVEHLKKDPLINYRIIKNLRVPVQKIGRKTRDLAVEIEKADLVVDAIFGVGLNRGIKGVFAEVIDLINCCAKKAVAVDIPSGLNGTNGKVFDVCIKADLTVTFSFAKKGMASEKGKQYCGKVSVVDIGIPKILFKKYGN